MKILAVDTSSSMCSVGLLIDGHISTIDKKLPMQQAQYVLPMINELLELNKIHLKQLDALAFGCGPGSFTGIRIATSVVQGFGFALGIPIISISSLAALAQSAYEDLGWKNLLVLVDARMQEVYSGSYRAHSNGLVFLIGSEAVIQPHHLILPDDATWCGVGDGWDTYRNQLPFCLDLTDPTRVPFASGLLKLAQYQYLQKNWLKPEEALPVYLRNDVAKK